MELMTNFATTLVTNGAVVGVVVFCAKGYLNTKEQSFKQAIEMLSFSFKQTFEMQSINHKKDFELLKGQMDKQEHLFSKIIEKVESLGDRFVSKEAFEELSKRVGEGIKNSQLMFTKNTQEVGHFKSRFSSVIEASKVDMIKRNVYNPSSKNHYEDNSKINELYDKITTT